MVPQAEVARLFAALRSRLTEAEADVVLAQAGQWTAHYIIAHRIPRAAAGLISLMPVPIGARLLLTAIARHAWTFAGDGRVGISRGHPMRLDIGANPLATPGCPWHCATIAELFRQLVAPHVRVEHPGCCARGDELCRFEFAF